MVEGNDSKQLEMKVQCKQLITDYKIGLYWL